jgi:FMN phosphatase YigB (HAD superfamily)
VYALFRTPAAWELLPGAGEALRELHGEGRRLGIISEMDGRLFDVLAAFGLESLFDPIVLSMRAGCSKRDGAIYAYALAHTPVPAGQCLHIGYHLEWDVEAARAAGLAVVRFDARERGGAPPDVPVARRWAEIPPLVRILEADR